MDDVSARVRDLQPGPPRHLFRPAGPGATADPVALRGTPGFAAFDRDILAADRLDGITYGRRTLEADDLGRAFVAERGKGTTRLYFVWVPGPVAERLRSRTLTAPLNVHVLLHPLTYEDNYTKAIPYWPGVFEGTAQYVLLGIRYLCEEFRAVAHHLTARPGADPNLVYVVPVADKAGNFADLVTPDGLTSALDEVNAFLAARLASGPPQFAETGRIMLSVYSRSGDRLAALMSRIAARSEFFARRLTQVNAFDINLGDNDEQRLPVLARLWTAIGQWATANPDARCLLYTAYRSHFDHCVARPLPGGWSKPVTVDLDKVDWSDPSTKGARGEPRGTALETYAPGRRFGLVCLPASFFRYYIPNTTPDRKRVIFVGNRTRGWQDDFYQDNRWHGHGLFLRAMLSHALAHGHPDFYAARPAPAARPASGVVRERPLR